MFRPILNAVVIRPEPEAELTDGSFLLPAGAEPKGHWRQGTVVSVGEGHRANKGRRRGEHLGCDVAVGDRVFYHPGLFRHEDKIYRPYDRFDVDGEELDIVAEEHIAAVIE